MSHPSSASSNLDTVFGALAHPTRRAILYRLRSGPASVGELAEPFGATQQAISKHISVLRKAGLIEHLKHGRESRCSLRPSPLEDADLWMSLYRPLWDERFDKLAAFLESARQGKLDG